MNRPVTAIVIASDFEPIRQLLRQRGFTAARVFELPYSTTPVGTVKTVLETIAQTTGEGLVILAYDGHGKDVRVDGKIDHQAWVFHDGELADSELVQIIKKFAATVELALIIECCFAMATIRVGPFRFPFLTVRPPKLFDLATFRATIAKGLSGAIDGPRWVALAPEISGAISLDGGWTEQLVSGAVANPTYTYRDLVGPPQEPFGYVDDGGTGAASRQAFSPT